MIPISLTIQGLYSYQRKQVIDFTKLTAAGLFGIFGGVGSGKSSILEAITFAIYGETDRLHKRDNRYYNMMNLKSDELLIDFIFEAGRDRTTFRSIVTGKRNSRRFDEVKTLDRSAYRKIAKEWVPIGNGELEEATGLSYDNFKRTIIIPQGQFQEFLQLGNKDRTQMMKELFNLGKFEFSSRVGSLERKNNEKIQNVTGKLQQLGEISPEQAEQYQEQLSQLEKEIYGLEAIIDQNQRKEEQFRRLQLLIEKKEEAEKKYVTLQKQETVYKELEKKIARYELCVNRFKQLLGSLKEHRKKEKERNEAIHADDEKLQLIIVGIERLAKFLDELKPEYEKREELKRKADDLSCLLRIKTLEKDMAEESARVIKGTEYWTKISQEAEFRKSEKQQLENNLKILRQKMPDLALLSSINTWHIERKHLVEQLTETERKIESYYLEEAKFEREKTVLLADPLLNMLPSGIDFALCREQLRKVMEEIVGQQQALHELETHLRVKEKLKGYAENLTEGTPCPVCGSTHHPALYRSEDISLRLLKIKDEKNYLEERIKQITGLERSTDLLEKNIQQTGREKSAWQHKKEELLHKITAHDGQFIWDKYADKGELDQAFNTAKRIDKEIKTQDKTAATVAEELEMLAKKRDAARDKLENLKNTFTDHQAQLRTLQQQLKIVHREQYTDASAESIEIEREQLLAASDRIEKEYVTGNEQLQGYNSERDRIQVRLDINRNELKKEQTARESLEQQLQSELEESNFRSEEEVIAILSETISTEKEKQNIKAFYEELLKRKSSFEQYRNEVGEREYDSAAHQKIIAEFRWSKDQQQQKADERGKVSVKLEELLKNMERRTSLLKEQEELLLRGENIRMMKSLFMASGFVNYISSVYLQNLCHVANNRFFQLTRQRLSLEITEDNNFQVRDFMNGGKVRSVKTLSGGQNFQASLSLALALADNIQQITQSNQNFFFLDEGFGTLDKESLDIVFDTLKSLRKENRIVGIISHVEEMQQEIEVHLRVENEEEHGSIIHRSWEV